VEGLFNEGLLNENVVYDRDDSAFEHVQAPAAVNPQLLKAWSAFLQDVPLPEYAYLSGYLHTPLSRTIPSGLREFKQTLMKRYGEDIGQLNRALGTDYESWNSLRIVAYFCLDRWSKPVDSAFMAALNEYKARTPLALRYYASVDGFYKKLYLKPLYGVAIADYNKEHGTTYGSYDDIRVARTWAENATAREREDWAQFTRLTLALQWIRVDDSALPAYHQYLRAKHDTIATLNKYYGTAYQRFDEVPLITEPPLRGMAVSDWEAFIAGWKDPDTQQSYQAPVESLRLHSVDWMFRDHLVKTCGSLEAVNQRLGTRYASAAEIRMPQREFHYAWFLENRRALRLEFITRNYKTVSEYVLFHGRGIMNTVIYCSLAVLISLLVNPLAAYALSRYKMPPTYKILLFLMATMAFPPMVTAIPNFLMLRRLNLLNTFAALILPGMASGYSIFLLKGFFDSLPRELYESAALDGANEWTIFWQLTMALSKPILAVIALGAFTGAYSNFMFAFVVCQDEKMWTLMVWLYQLQQMSGQAVMYASLLIASIPTFIIFLFCQNLIMRGIVVPSEK
jgi:multiple sugar transport system permease protein